MSNEFAPDEGDTSPEELDEVLECEMLQTPAGRQMLAALKFSQEE